MRRCKPSHPLGPRQRERIAALTPWRNGKQTALLEPFLYQNDHFAKTGSDQA
jgi:hypothetical protein